MIAIERAREIVAELAGFDRLGPVDCLVLTEGEGGAWLLADDHHSEPARLESEQALRGQIAEWLRG